MKVVHGWAFPDADGFMSERLGASGQYQRANLDAAMRHVRGRALAVDGGAHVGTWSRPMAQWFDQVVAFEPSPDTFECLARNLHDLPNVVMRNQALGKAPGKVTMTLDGFERAIAMRNTGARFVRVGGDVDCITLDSLDLAALDFLKLDVEGSEVDALMGAEQSLRKHRPVVLFESKRQWKRYGYRGDAPHRFLSGLGAHFLDRVGVDEVWGWPHV